MAYQQDFNDDENQNNQPQTGNETVLTPASSSVSSAPGPTPSQPSNKPKGTGFTNLSQYVDANRPQAAEMAGQITGKIQENIASQNQAARTAAQNSQSQAAANIVKDQGVSAQLNKDPTAFNQAQWQDYYKNATKAYAGPTSFEADESFQNLANQAAQNKQSIENLKTNTGRTQAVQDQYAQDRNYGRGQNLLDSFLIGTGGGAEKLGEFQSQIAANNPNDQWQNLINTTNEKLKAAQTESANTKKNVETLAQSKLGAATSNIQNAQNALQSKNAAASTQLQGLQSKLSSPDTKARAEAFQSLGLDPAAGEWLLSQGYNPSQLIQQTGLKGLGDVANAKDVGDYQALSNLLGQQSQFDLSKTGGADNAYKVNSNLVNSAKSAFDLNSLLNSKLSAEQGKRDKTFEEAQSAIAGNTFVPRSAEEQAMAAKALGLSTEEYKYAMDNGLFKNDQLSQGSKLNLGDVASQSERSQLSSLMKALGLGGTSLDDTQDEGAAFKFSGAGDIKKQYANSLPPMESALKVAAPAAVQTQNPAIQNYGQEVKKIGGETSKIEGPKSYLETILAGLKKR